MKRPRQIPRCHADDFRAARCGPGRAGFSLLEVFIVVALLLILTTMYWSSTSSSANRKQQKLCSSNLQKIYIAMQIYANDSAGNFPVATNARTSEAALELLVPRYTVDTTLFLCPGSSDGSLISGEPLSQGRINYAYYMGRRLNTAEALMSDAQVDTQPKTAGQLVFSANGKAPGNNHQKSGGNFLFGDGRVELTPARAPFPLALPPGVTLLNPKP